MEERADAVVVGAGVQGAALALHLLERGLDDVVLLDRGAPFAGTSGAGAGFVALWAAVTARPYGAEELAVEHYGLAFYRRLHDAGHDLDLAQNGMLLVGASDAALAGFADIVRTDRDPDTAVVTGAEVERLTAGTIVGEEVAGGVFQPAAAHVYTPKVGRALVAAVERAGGRIAPHRPVTALAVEGGRVVGVRTPAGPVAADVVVLAAGAWTNALLRPHGVFLPMAPQITSRIISAPLGLPDTLPALMLAGVTPDGPRLWLRGHEGGLLWGGVYLGPARDALVGADPLPDDLGGLPDDGVRACEAVAAAATAVMPALGRMRTLRVDHGVPCFTPDSRALVGAVPGIDGLYALAGDNEAGVTHGPGFAKALADHIVTGASDLAGLDAWRLDRFDGAYATERAVAATLH